MWPVDKCSSTVDNLRATCEPCTNRTLPQRHVKGTNHRIFAWGNRTLISPLRVHSYDGPVPATTSALLNTLSRQSLRLLILAISPLLPRGLFLAANHANQATVS